MGYNHEQRVTITVTLPAELVVELVGIQMQHYRSLDELAYIALTHFVNQTKSPPDFKAMAEQEVKQHINVYGQFGKA